MEQQAMQVSVQVRTSPKDFFLHLLGMVALYTSAISFLMIVFSMINFYVPDPLQQGDYYRHSNLRGDISGSLSVFVVFFPVFLFVTRFLNRMYEVMPEKRGLSVRKWLIYLTLFVSALVMMGFLVTTIRSFLDGSLTLQFGLQVIAIFFVAGSIFWYYFSDVKRYGTE
ncbi:MAG: hypothetical protein HZA36_00345 [Parcubacteria group bacterium]|nr:hypothetical protein [Parcubacteria group bacterium]